jgi:hypothetical protein
MKHKLGIIVPYRNREEQLNTFINKTSHILDNTPEIDYEIIIVDQVDDKPFNRGKLLNIGVEHASKKGCTYVILHDVDMIPHTVDYRYENRPTLLATNFIDINNKITQSFDGYFGGVTLFPIDQFKKINGYSNEYWGWGFEDDDLLWRCDHLKLPLYKQKKDIHYKSTTSLHFNGVDSSVTSPMDYGLKNYTIIVSVNPSKVVIDDSLNVDNYNILTILPNLKHKSKTKETPQKKNRTTLSYNSFKQINFTTWTANGDQLSLNSEIHSPIQTIIAVTVNIYNKTIKLYQNGELVSVNQFSESPLNHNGETLMMLGDINEYSFGNKPFFGDIDYFAIFKHSLNDNEIKEISLEKNMGLTEQFGNTYKNVYDLEVLYDMKISTNETIYDLSGNNRHGIVHHCDRVPMKSNPIIVKTPYKKQCLFTTLPHRGNGYNPNLQRWTHKETRQNQIRYHNQVLNGEIDYMKDGLNTLEYKTDRVDTLKNNIIKVNVHL